MKEVYYVQVKPPLIHLKLNNSCHAVNKDVTIPATFEDFSHIEIPQNHFNFTLRNEFWNPIIDTLHLNQKTVPRRVNTIASTGELLSNIRNEIQLSYQDEDQTSPFWWDTFKQILFIVIIALVIIVVVEFVLHCGLLKLCKHRCNAKFLGTRKTHAKRSIAS